MGLLDWAFRPVLNAIDHLRKETKMDMQALATQLTAVGTQLAKAKTEITDKIAALEEAIGNAGSTTPEVDAALEALKGAAQGLDDLNPDAVPTP
jgi:hypothetical protein